MGATIVEGGFINLPPKSIVLGRCVHISAQKGQHCFCHSYIDQKSVSQQVLEKILCGFNPDGYQVTIADYSIDVLVAAWILKYPSRVFEKSTRMLIDDFARFYTCGNSYEIIYDPQRIKLFNSALSAMLSKTKSFALTVDLIEDFITG